MPDVFTKAKRSEVMSRIRSRGNKDTELALAKLLRAHKISGWRRQVRVAVGSSKLRVERRKRSASPRPSPQKSVTAPRPSPGFASLSRSRERGIRGEGVRVRPDFVFPKLKLALFVDGCFWHGCPWHATWPANRAAWWRRKIVGNKVRDALVTRTLRRAGWHVLRVWEHELAKKNRARLARRLSVAISG